MPEHLKIDYLELPASDITAVKQFYRSVFDWQFTDYGDDYCAFTDGKLDGGLFRSEQQSRTSNGAALIVFYSVDLEATRDSVLAAGGEIAQDIFAFPGGRRFHFLDPGGNELAVWSDVGVSD